jgi:hypothetical protein
VPSIVRGAVANDIDGGDGDYQQQWFPSTGKLALHFPSSPRTR